MFDVHFFRSEGIYAFETGLELSDNPYEKDSAEYKVWAAGWKQAERKFSAGLVA